MTAITVKSLKLSNKSPKQPIKNLPASIELSPTTTVDDVKVQIAKAARIGDHNRVGLFDPTTKKTLKDRKALISEVATVASAGEVLVKDLGPQVAWRTVFFVEYLGPILIHPLMLAARPYIYKGSPAPTDLSTAQWISFGMFMLHFLKREYETIFVHKFSANTMPALNIFRNSFYYWATYGVLCAASIYRPSSYAAIADQPAVDAAGTLLFLFGQISNAVVHSYLASLRASGSTERKIPVGYGFSLVTCPNYMFEVIAWLGAIVVTRDWTLVLSIILGISKMWPWAVAKEKAYRKEFGDRYKKKRYSMLPGLF